MHYQNKIVIQIPLQTIWTDEKELSVQRERYLLKSDIEELLQLPPLNFVVANVGDRLLWIDPPNKFTFWKNEVKNHIAENPDYIYLNDFNDNYAYVASLWTEKNSPTIILLEKIH